MPRLPRVELLIVAVLSTATAMAALVGVWRSSSSPPLPPSLTGPCSVQARVEPGGVVIDPSVSAGVYRLPLDGTVSYQAAIGTATDGPRPLQGQVVLDLPRPLPDPVLGSWDEPGALADNAGSTTYRLDRWWAPSGAVVTIRAEHREPGAVCAGALTVRLAGTGIGLRTLLVVLLLASAALTSRAARPSRRSVADGAGTNGAGTNGTGTNGTGEPIGAAAAGRSWPWDPAPAGNRTRPHRLAPAGRPGLGLVAGGLFGLTASGLVLLAGTVGLASSWVLAGPVAGATVGAVLGWWAPAKAAPGRSRRRSGSDDGPELPLLDPS
jgi:hypothetical protein